MIDALRSLLDDGQQDALSGAAFQWAPVLPGIIAAHGWQLYGLASMLLVAAVMASVAMWRVE